MTYGEIKVITRPPAYVGVRTHRSVCFYLRNNNNSFMLHAVPRLRNLRLTRIWKYHCYQIEERRKFVVFVLPKQRC